MIVVLIIGILFLIKRLDKTRYISDMAISDNTIMPEISINTDENSAILKTILKHENFVQSCHCLTSKAPTMPTDNNEGEILTIRQVADYLKVTERTIYRLAAAKKIPAFKVGGTWRFSLADIDSWIKQQSMEGLDTGRESGGEAGEQIQDREKK